MSGRLIILPKKSYTPWNPANVERVLRDERLDRERKEKERKEEDSRLASSRIEALKFRKRQNQGHNIDNVTVDNAETSIQKQGHVNFFEKEEKESINKVEKIISTSKTDVKYHETRVFLGDKNKQSLKKKRVISLRSQQKLKREMDPMNQFLSRNEWKELSNLPSNTVSFTSNKSSALKIDEEIKSKSSQSDNDSSSSMDKKRKKKSRKSSKKKKSKRKDGKNRHRVMHYDNDSTDSDNSSLTYAKYKSASKKYKKKKERKQNCHDKYNIKRKRKRYRGEEDDDDSTSSSSHYSSKRSKYQKASSRSHEKSHKQHHEISNKSISLNELRKKRMEREKLENSRESKIISHGQNRSKPYEYQNQYYPSLTRRHHNDRFNT